VSEVIGVISGPKVAVLLRLVPEPLGFLSIPCSLGCNLLVAPDCDVYVGTELTSSHDNDWKQPPAFVLFSFFSVLCTGERWFQFIPGWIERQMLWTLKAAC